MRCASGVDHICGAIRYFVLVWQETGNVRVSEYKRTSVPEGLSILAFNGVDRPSTCICLCIQYADDDGGWIMDDDGVGGWIFNVDAHHN